VDPRVIDELEIPVEIEVLPEVVRSVVGVMLLIEPPGNREETKMPSRRSPAVTPRIASFLWCLMPVPDPVFITRLSKTPVLRLEAKPLFGKT